MTTRVVNVEIHGQRYAVRSDLDAATTRIAELESSSSETIALRDEREKIRLRVVEIISHIDKLNL